MSMDINDFKNNGLTIIRGFLTEEEVENIKQECAHIVTKMIPSEHCSIFQTGSKQVGDNYFLNSGDKISFFFEEGAVDNTGNLIVDKTVALNKIGHALHWWNPAFKKVTFSKKVKELLLTLGYKDPVVVQSMYIFKHPEIGGEVQPHQDSTFLYTEPLSTVGLWFPLVDVAEDNGCLFFVPGSHKGPVSQRLVRNPDKEPLLTLLGDRVKYDNSKYIPAHAKKGDCVVIHGTVVHKSGKNTTDKSRPVYTFHVVEGNSIYSSDNWLQPSSKLPFPSVYKVAETSG